MKMGAIFWGLLIIFIGLSIIIKVVFNVNFPIVKIFIALAIIYIGLRILLGSFNVYHREKNKVVFGESRYKNAEDGKSYEVVFGKATFDLRNVTEADLPKELKFKTVFGKTHIKVNKDTPLRVDLDAVFSGASLPNGNTVVFGHSSYENEFYQKRDSSLVIKADVVFGDFEIETY